MEELTSVFIDDTSLIVPRSALSKRNAKGYLDQSSSEFAFVLSALDEHVDYTGATVDFLLGLLGEWGVGGIRVTPRHVRTTALWAVSARFMYHLTYVFCGLGGTSRLRAMVPIDRRANIIWPAVSIDDGWMAINQPLISITSEKLVHRSDLIVYSIDKMTEDIG